MITNDPTEKLVKSLLYEVVVVPSQKVDNKVHHEVENPQYLTLAQQRPVSAR